MAATIRSKSSRVPGATDPPFPISETGDRLSLPEFELCDDVIPEVKKAELIEGGDKMGSPVGSRRNSKPYFDLRRFNWFVLRDGPFLRINSGQNGSFEAKPSPASGSIPLH